VKIDIASEFRYRKPVLTPGTLALFVSQSGETADTLAALRYCKEAGLKTAAVVNVPTSTIAREVNTVWPTLAGPEIGVASTKAFTAQLCALAAAVIAVGKAKGTISREEEVRLITALSEVPPERDQLHPRRRLCERRAKTRAHSPDRRRYAGDLCCSV